MGSIRKIAARIAVLWLVGVVVLGVGGTWAYHNQEDAVAYALGIDPDEVQAREAAEKAERLAKAKAAQYGESGWGDDVLPGQDAPSDWGY